MSAGDIDRTGGFGIQAIAAPQNLKKLEAAISEELQRALKDGFTAAEVADAKSGMMQQRVQNRSKDDVLAMGWTKNLFLGRTYEWSKAFEAKLMALTPAQVNAAFRKAIDPTKMSVVVAGDKTKAAAGR
jgi:zinc protease